MKVTVTFRDGGAIVEASKLVHATNPDAAKAVRAVLRRPQVDDGTPTRDPKTGTITEGVIRKLRRGTVEFDMAALSKLPEAFVIEP